jgi:D-alanyl-lipoteichoic acid acyltransferase DltB (MBOAT superfamily)
MGGKRPNGQPHRHTPQGLNDVGGGSHSTEHRGVCWPRQTEFKYLAFISANIGAPVGPVQSTALPLAISFYTFNQIGYLVARYRREVLAHEFLDYALFVAFFPYLIAGPIVHYQQLAVQFRSPTMRLSTRNFAVCITIFVVGMFKKIVMADTLAGYADLARLIRDGEDFGLADVA